jgi:homoserine dehydrogenase
MPEISLILVGFGNVGKAFVRLLQRKSDLLRDRYDLTYRITGIATGRHGMVMDPDGLDPQKILEVEDFSTLSRLPQPSSVIDLIQRCPGDFMFENSPVNHETGQPAIDHIRTALQRKMHVVTANKGPVVHGYHELIALAAENGRSFLFESAVMDGAPIFSVFREPLPLTELHGFTGILNSCTNFILGMMDEGKSFEEAVSLAQSIGITETDPSEDIDGWDAAVKAAALVTVLMGVPMKPQQVDRTGIRSITPIMLAEARAAGERWKLVCTAVREGDDVHARVVPQRVRPDSPLFAINGTNSYVQFHTDVLPGLGIIESDPGPETTAYGLLADMINALRAKGMLK